MPQEVRILPHYALRLVTVAVTQEKDTKQKTTPYCTDKSFLPGNYTIPCGSRAI